MPAKKKQNIRKKKIKPALQQEDIILLYLQSVMLDYDNLPASIVGTVNNAGQ